MTVVTPAPFEAGFRLQDGSLLDRVLANPLVSTEDNITATGTTQATGYKLLANLNRFSVAAANSGAQLPLSRAGLIIRVINDGVAPATIYGNAGETCTIDGTDGATGVALTNGQVGTYYCLAQGKWISTMTT